MLVSQMPHLPRGDKLTPGNDPTIYALNSLIQTVGKHEGKKISAPMAKKFKQAIVRIHQNYNKRVGNREKKRLNIVRRG